LRAVLVAATAIGEASSPAWQAVLFVVAAAGAWLGHSLGCFLAFDQINSRAWPRPVQWATSQCLKLSLAAGPVVLVVAVACAGGWFGEDPFGLVPWPVAAYAVACWGLLAVRGPALVRDAWRLAARSPALVSNHTERHDWRAELGSQASPSPIYRAVLQWPGNDALRPEVTVKEVRIARLPAELDGLSIVHWSDLHNCGRTGRAYFERLVEESDRLDGDLVAVTGDVVDRPWCVPWIGETLGRLRSRHGVWAVLGNHDARRDSQPTRAALQAAGIFDAGLSDGEITIRGRRVLVAGNERPWFALAPEPPGLEAGHDLRLLLAHSPDQFGWARERGFDLMLAGHTHGGQVRFPGLGPVVACSRHGVRYAAGVFQEGPTVLHVTRGVSGMFPLRFRCRPELVKLVLRCGGASSAR
jgi:hypothetical protein